MQLYSFIALAARSTLILEKLVRCKCSYFSRGSHSLLLILNIYLEGDPRKFLYRSFIKLITVLEENKHSYLTHKFRDDDALQLRVVFNRCGGSEKKKKYLLVVNGFSVLCTSCLLES